MIPVRTLLLLGFFLPSTTWPASAQSLARAFQSPSPPSPRLKLTPLQYPGVPAMDRSVVGLVVSEISSGDANGDGDAIDSCVWIADHKTGVLTGLGLAASFRFPFRAHDPWLVFAVSEFRQGSDLNGDGDTDDDVLHVHDRRTGTARNLGVACATFDSSGDLAVATVLESEQHADLDGDGDSLDRVPFVVDLETGVARNLGVITEPDPQTDGERVVFRSAEFLHGPGKDWNGDGDRGDVVLWVYEARTRELRNLGLACHPNNVVLRDGIVHVAVDERMQAADLNGDGDLLDRVLHLDGPRLSRNVGVAAAASFSAFPSFPDTIATGGRSGRFVLHLVREENQGATDLDGDGLVFGDVLFEFDTETGTLRNLRTRAQNLVVSGSWAAFTSRERQDLNGDGDLDDLIAHVHRMGTPQTKSLGLATARPHLAGNWVAVGVGEGMQARDLNADGDRDDIVLFLYDLATGAARNMQLDCGGMFSSNVAPSLALDSERVVFLVRERDQGADWNGDGDIIDLGLAVMDPMTGRIARPRLSVDPLPNLRHESVRLESGKLLFNVRETSQGQDLNADGDLDDLVMYLGSL